MLLKLCYGIYFHTAHHVHWRWTPEVPRTLSGAVKKDYTHLSKNMISEWQPNYFPLWQFSNAQMRLWKRSRSSKTRAIPSSCCVRRSFFSEAVSPKCLSCGTQEWSLLPSMWFFHSHICISKAFQCTVIKKQLCNCAKYTEDSFF